MTAPSYTNFIWLNIGGSYFATRRSTLGQGNLLSLCVDSDETDIFIDRDPTNFRYILNWLRGGKCLPHDDAVLEELKVECDYYSIDEMKEAIRKKLSNPSRTTSIARGLKGVQMAINNLPQTPR